MLSISHMTSLGFYFVVDCLGALPATLQFPVTVAYFMHIDAPIPRCRSLFSLAVRTTQMLQMDKPPIHHTCKYRGIVG